MQYDEFYGTPFVKEIESTSPWYVNLPPKFRQNIWVLAINAAEPITPTAAYDAIEHETKNKSYIFEIVICKWEPTTLTQHKQLRATFDQIQSSQRYSATTETEIKPTANYAISCPVKPDQPDHFGDFHKSPFRIEWKKGLFENYTKNAKVGLFTKPFPIEDVPEGQTILNSRVTFKVKELAEPHMWDLYCRHCADGSVQTKGIDFLCSHSAIVTCDSIRFGIAFAASRSMGVYIIDIGNAYQTTQLSSTKRLYVRCPPYYVEWFKDTYPTIPLPPAKTCFVIQAVYSIQGSKTAGNEWFELSSSIFKKMGMKQNSIDNAVFTFRFGDQLLILMSNVDDFLIFSDTPRLYDKVKTKLASLFDLTTQEGPVIRFLNLRIISSQTAISIDQTKHILNMVEPFFPKLHHFTKVNTPQPTRNTFETEYMDALPATTSELRALEIEFGGSYLTLYGQLLHVATISRPQIANAFNRLGKFQSLPNCFAFTYLRHLFQYLASNPNIPLIYAKLPITTKSPIACFHHTKKMEIPHCLTSLVDLNFATDLSDRKSVSSDIILYGGSAITWKVHKDMCIATSSTDAETRAIFKGVRRVITLRGFMTSLGFPVNTPTSIFEDNKGTHDLIEAKRMTPRLKHIDIPICYLHEKFKSGEFVVYEYSTHLTLADGLNKTLSGQTLKHHSNIYTGRRFLPPPTSTHYKLLIELCPLS